MLVTLQEASDHLRRDQAEDDTYLELLIRAASQAVVTYLGSMNRAYYPEIDSNGNFEYDSNGDPVPELDSNDDPVIRDDVRWATLIYIGELYKHREAEQDGAVDPQFGYGYLPRPCLALLYPYRDPAFA